LLYEAEWCYRKDKFGSLLNTVYYTPAGGLLKIEDVLPFFPDFVTIDNFKEAICDSLERYNKQVRNA
jgi:hypothetical protein